MTHWERLANKVLDLLGNRNLDKGDMLWIAFYLVQNANYELLDRLLILAREINVSYNQRMEAERNDHIYL